MVTSIEIPLLDEVPLGELLDKDLTPVLAAAGVEPPKTKSKTGAFNSYI